MSFSKKKTITYSVLLLLSLGLFVTACKNNNDDDDDGPRPEKTGYAGDQLLLEHFNNNADRIVEKAFLLGAESIGSCVKLVINDKTDDPGLTPDTMYIKFGSTDCLGYDGKIRRGEMIVAYDKDKDMHDPGYYIKVKYNGYQVSGYRLSGYQEISNVGKDASGNIQYSITRVDTVVLPDDQGVVTGKSERVRVWFKGSNTKQLSDDVYRTTGSGTFIRANGDEYSTEIKEPLYTALNCNWITNGTINIYPKDATQRVLDYGGGECENDATINVNGVISSVQAPE